MEASSGSNASLLFFTIVVVYMPFAYRSLKLIRLLLADGANIALAIKGVVPPGNTIVARPSQNLKSRLPAIVCI